MGRTADSTSSIEGSKRAPVSAPQGVVLGRIVGVHGLRGELRVRLDATNYNLRAATSVRLARAEGDPKTVEARVRAVGSGRGGEQRLALEGVESAEQASALRGLLVLARAEDLEPLAPGEYYQYELVGCRVEDGEGRELGVVKGFWDTGGPGLLVVAAGEGPERLVPAAPEFLRKVDMASRCIVIEAPPGLFDE